MNTKQLTLEIFVLVIFLALLGCAPGQLLVPTSTPLATITSTATITPTAAMIPTVTSTATETPKLIPQFVIGDTPFRFVGAFTSGQIWQNDYWDETVIEDYIASAKASGISVLHVMSPQYESELGVFREDQLQRLDFFLATASKYGVYIAFNFLHGLLISKPESDDPYYHPRGVEGLIIDEQLNQAFKHHIEVLLTRTNTVNGVVYREDPTILGWIVIEDPIQNPINMPSGELPRITIPEFHDWLDDIAVYIKSVDSRHLVGIMLDTPNLDFIEAEDTDLQDLISLNKPFFIMVTNRYLGPDEGVCEDFPIVVAGIGQIFTESLDNKAAGVVIRVWQSDLAKIPPYDKCYNFTDSMEPIRDLLLGKANELNVPGFPFPPLGFVSVSH
jgi:hypothetical protein